MKCCVGGEQEDISQRRASPKHSQRDLVDSGRLADLEATGTLQ